MTLSSGPNLGLLVHGDIGETHYAELMRQFRGLDGLIQPSVIERGRLTPPTSPEDGAMYIIGGSPTGLWSGRAFNVARWSEVASQWEFYIPKDGWEFFVTSESTVYRYVNNIWVLQQGSDSSVDPNPNKLLTPFDGDMIPLMPKPASVTSEPASTGSSTDWLPPASRRRFLALLDTAIVNSGATGSSMGQLFTIAGEAAGPGMRMYNLEDFITRITTQSASSAVAVTVQGGA